MVLIESVEVEYTFSVLQVQFSHVGRYYLELHIQNSSVDTPRLMPKVRHSVNNGELSVGHSTRTDIIDQLESDKSHVFMRNLFTFVLPRGFCRNDMSHDVRLVVEAFQISDSRSNQGSRISENVFAIYPRTNEPKINLDVHPSQYMYMYSQSVSLLRTLSSDPMQVHAGRVKFEASLKQHIPRTVPRTPDPPPPRALTPPQPRPAPQPRPVAKPAPIPIPEPETPSEDTFIDELPPSEEPPRDSNMNFFLENSRPVSREAISVNPAGQGDAGHSTGQHVTSEGQSEVLVKVHAAVNLPEDKNEGTPTPYVVARVIDNESGNVRTQGVTRAVGPDHDPHWNEILLLQYPSTDPQDNSLLLAVADGPTKESIASYKFDLNNLVPFHEYHFDFSKIDQGSKGGGGLYVSITRKSSRLPREIPSTPYWALEATVLEAETNFNGARSPLYAVARIVPDIDKYSHEMLRREPRPAGLRLQSVLFPRPLPEAFKINQGHLHGFPRIDTEGGTPTSKPVWNESHLFLPSKDIPAFFGQDTALVIEYYESDKVMTDVSWSVHSPVAFSVVPLTRVMLSHLTKSPQRGVTVSHVPVLSETVDSGEQDKPATVLVALRLIEHEKPEKLDAGTLKQLPLVPLDRSRSQTPAQRQPSAATRQSPLESTANQESDTFPPWKPILNSPEYERGGLPRPRPDPNPRPPAEQRPIQRDEWPTQGAVDDVLPNDDLIFRMPKGERPGGGGDTYSRPVAGEFDDRAMRIIDQQMQDLENYRRAVKKMSEDILKLREQVAKTESHNSQLRRQAMINEESSKALLNVSELEGISKADLIDRYIALRRKLAEHSNELKTYKDKVQILQNQVIKKNDKEKSFMQLQQAHTAQQALLMKYQDKSAKFKQLEDTVKAQEKVIAKMEKLVQQKGKTLKDADDQRQKIEEALKLENDRLRGELRRERENRQQLEEQEADRAANGNSDKAEDIIKLRALEEEAEERDIRFQALQRALEDNSRQWGREKEELLRRITELERGFARSPVMIMGNNRDRLPSPYYKPRNYPARLEPLS